MKAINKIPARMFLYGSTIGSLTSGLTFAVHRSYHSDNITEIVLDFIYTLPIGLFMGGLAGIFSGIAMDLLLRSYPCIHLKSNDVIHYRFLAGVATFFSTGAVFTPALCGASLMIIEGPFMLINIFLSIAIAIYCCQLTITKYLKETDNRKSKIK